MSRVIRQRFTHDGIDGEVADLSWRTAWRGVSRVRPSDAVAARRTRRAALLRDRYSRAKSYGCGVDADAGAPVERSFELDDEHAASSTSAATTENRDAPRTLVYSLSASAPPMISISSFVIAACRARL
ncbi:MAG: hypothetical protein JWP87_5938 [Labilithrix sp.]|nr:hypothetical protein [Labilithrix sp.]